MVYNRLRDGHIVRYVRLATFAKAVRLRPAFLSEAPAGFFRQGFASAYGCSRQGVPSVFHSVPLHLRTSPNRKSIAGHCGGCVLPYRCAKVSGAGSAYGRYLPLPAQYQKDISRCRWCIYNYKRANLLKWRKDIIPQIVYTEVTTHSTTQERNDVYGTQYSTQYRFGQGFEWDKIPQFLYSVCAE